MSYYVADVNGYIDDVASNAGLADFRVWAYSVGGVLQTFMRDGHTTDIKALREALGSHESDDPSIERTRKGLLSCAREAEDVLILSDGANGDDVQKSSLGNEAKGSPDQPRDDHGRWTNGGASDAILSQPSSAYPAANPDGKDTESRFMKDGRYTPERQALHEAILQKYLAGHGPAEGAQVATMLGGGPASGKSTIANVMSVPTDSVHVDVDVLRTELPEYREMLAAKDAHAAAFTHEEASYLGKQLTRQAIKMGSNVMVDGTGDSSYDNLASKVGRLRETGAKVNAHYVTCDTDEAVRRAEARGANTGRYVPESFIRATHASVSRVFPRAIAQGLFDHATLWETTHGGAKKVVSASGSRLTIHDKEAWNRFLAKGDVKGYGPDHRADGAHSRRGPHWDDALAAESRSGYVQSSGAARHQPDQDEGRHRGDSAGDAGLKYDESQPRDDHGRWGDGGGFSTKPDIIIGSHFAPQQIHDYLQKNGAKEFEAAKLPKEVVRGPKGECYANATQAMWHNPELGLQFAEGFAYEPNTGLHYQHAWCVDRNGKVVDPTWDHPEKCKYYGVVYDKKPYVAFITKTKYYGVLGNSFTNANRVMKRGKL